MFGCIDIPTKFDESGEPVGGYIVPTEFRELAEGWVNDPESLRRYKEQSAERWAEKMEALGLPLDSNPGDVMVRLLLGLGFFSR